MWVEIERDRFGHADLAVRRRMEALWLMGHGEKHRRMEPGIESGATWFQRIAPGGASSNIFRLSITLWRGWEALRLMIQGVQAMGRGRCV